MQFGATEHQYFSSLFSKLIDNEPAVFVSFFMVLNLLISYESLICGIHHTITE